jgi:hypothetical protein
MRNVIIFFAAFGALALLVLGLQYIPTIGFIAMYLGGPLWFGLILHLGLVAMLVLSVIGLLPRALLAVPLVVWIAGLLGWLYTSQAAERHAAALKTTITFTDAPRELFVKGDQQLASELVADYQLDQVFTEFHRHRLEKGAGCTPAPKHDPNRILWVPPKLARRGECVISQRAEPPARLLEVESLGKERRPTASGGEIVPLKISVYQGDQPQSRTVDYGTERVLAPLLFPIVGFVYGSQAGERGSIAALWRLDHPLVEGAGDDNPPEAKARFVGETLGLKRR